MALRDHYPDATDLLLGNDEPGPSPPFNFGLCTRIRRSGRCGLERFAVPGETSDAGDQPSPLLSALKATPASSKALGTLENLRARSTQPADSMRIPAYFRRLTAARKQHARREGHKPRRVVPDSVFNIFEKCILRPDAQESNGAEFAFGYTAQPRTLCLHAAERSPIFSQAFNQRRMW